MSAYDDVATAMEREGCSAGLVTFHGRGTVLRVSDGTITIMAYVDHGSVEIWPYPGDPNGMPLAWARYERGNGAAEACDLIRGVLADG